MASGKQAFPNNGYISQAVNVPNWLDVAASPPTPGSERARSPIAEIGSRPFGEQGDEIYFQLGHADQARNLDGGTGYVRVRKKLPPDA